MEMIAVKTYPIVIARILMVVLVILGVHVLEGFAPWYFVFLGGAAGVMLLGQLTALPGLGFLTALNASDRLSIWIVLVCLTVIGYLHNANEWVKEGVFYHPLKISLWKTELVLGISLAAPLIHWIAGLFLPWVSRMNGQRFAREFALYVNFSGIALVLWTGNAAIAGVTLCAAVALVLLAELTLNASG
jgi:hypothetical protein